ncbi:CBM96 family carbohydrate-binding protein [Actinokineospora sp. HUAS TT18]|uniref:CBM96 family carbohydrate-binding protein n=1 Tax=Actinokineospora sp. HUAS TT18 TaxID=3447451 RepID=UPI003F522D99
MGGSRVRALTTGAAMCLAVGLVVVGPVAQPSAATSTTVFAPVADATAAEATPSTNAGGAAQLGVDGSPVERTYLKFTVAGLSGSVTSAKLRLHVSTTTGAESVAGGTVSGVSNTSWSETALTWANQPAVDGAALGSLGAVQRGAWYEIDVFAAVAGNGTISLALTSTNSDGVDYDSRESASAPQLVITTAPPVATFTPIADTTADSSTPAANYGTATQLGVDGSPVKRTFLKFDIGTATVAKAVLRLHTVNDANAGSTGGGGSVAKASSTSWSESGLTWANQPTTGSPVASLGPVVRDTWYEVDVTAAVTGGVVSLAITSAHADGADYDSRESAAKPQLVITSGSTSTDPVLIGVGDIATGHSDADTKTAAIVDGYPSATVYTLGDNVYQTGTATEFATFYEQTWGRFKARTRPTPGNHDYYSTGAAPYYAYFGANAGPSGRGYYSYDLGSWHIVSLNSETSMAAGSAQEQWLRADLAATSKTCLMAMWHKPRFTSSGHHAPELSTGPLVQALYEHNADVILSGHVHLYERFAQLNPTGALDTARGARHFSAGMGGADFQTFGTIAPNSEARNNNTNGVLKFTLHADSYDWEFLPVAGQTYRDSGSTDCH